MEVVSLKKVAMITGQDGAYLAELLLEKGYEAHGIKRRTSLLNTDRIDYLYQYRLAMLGFKANSGLKEGLTFSYRSYTSGCVG